MSGLRHALINELDASSDPDRATKQQRYMKSSMPFHGVMAPQLRTITRAVFVDHPLAARADWEATVLDLWRSATHREQLHAAIALAEHRPYRGWLDADALPMIDEMIVSGAWWDLVDPLAAHHLWHILSSDRAAIRPIVVEWTADADMWRRRSSMIVQLRAKADTDEELLFAAIEASIDSQEFFLRKAIGWALREYSKTAPHVVRGYVDGNSDRLSGLSRREAVRWLDRADRD